MADLTRAGIEPAVTLAYAAWIPQGACPRPRVLLTQKWLAQAIDAPGGAHCTATLLSQCTEQTLRPTAADTWAQVESLRHTISFLADCLQSRAKLT